MTIWKHVVTITIMLIKRFSHKEMKEMNYDVVESYGIFTLFRYENVKVTTEFF